MKLFTSILFTFIAILLISCANNSNSKKQAAAFCADTTCVQEPLLISEQGNGNPLVIISFKDCKIDSINWEKDGLGVKKAINFSEFVGKEVRISKEKISGEIIEAKFAWIKFNDCTTGRGFIIKLPFDKTGNTSKITSALNSFDPNYKVAEGLVSYYDNTFIYVEDIKTGLIAKTLLTDTGVRNIDYDYVHSLIESVDITTSHIKATIIVDGFPKQIDKPLVFK